jgi:hypothetical protein
MARFWKKASSDWCHVCGARQRTCVEIDYPTNAEHQFLSEEACSSDCGKGRYLRICADCGKSIVRIGRGEIKSDVRNNPALVTAHIVGIGDHFKPGVN